MAKEEEKICLVKVLTQGFEYGGIIAGKGAEIYMKESDCKGHEERGNVKFLQYK